MTTQKELKLAAKELDLLIESATKEITKLQNRIKKYQNHIDLLNEKQDLLNEKQDLLNKKQAELSSLEEQCNQAKSEAEATQEALVKKLEQAVNIDQILKSRNIMSRAIRVRRASGKDDFYAAQKVISNAVAQLRKIGISSKGLYDLAVMSHSRPDRDAPSSIELEDILLLEEVDIIPEDE